MEVIMQFFCNCFMTVKHLNITNRYADITKLRTLLISYLVQHHGNYLI